MTGLVIHRKTFTRALYRDASGAITACRNEGDGIPPLSIGPGIRLYGCEYVVIEMIQRARWTRDGLWIGRETREWLKPGAPPIYAEDAHLLDA